MPTILTHVVVPVALGLGLGRRLVSMPLLASGIVASILPDLDVLAFRFGISYSDQLGHRGFSHSVLFALLVGFAAFLFASRLRSSRVGAFSFVFIATISHGLLDMLTNGGMGVALLWPLSDARFFAPWQVIQVSPLSLSKIFGPKGLAVLLSELKWVWVPAALVSGLLAVSIRARTSKSSASGLPSAIDKVGP